MSGTATVVATSIGLQHHSYHDDSHTQDDQEPQDQDQHREHNLANDDDNDHGHVTLLSSAIPPSRTTTFTHSRSLSTSSTAAHRGGILSIPFRIVQWGLQLLLQLRASLPDSLRPWFWVGLWLFFALIGIGLFAGFHTKIFELLDQLALLIKGLGHAGPPLIMLGMFLTAFPPILGYSSFVTMSGYVYGFGYGFLIAYSSALLGSITCFYLGRKYFKKQVRTLMAKKQSVKSVVKAVEKRGFKLLLLIRLAPYPFNILNLTLSATHIPLRTFALATALSLTKLTLHVYIGSTLSSLAPIPTTPKTDDDNKSTTPGTDTGTGAEPIPHGRNNFKIAVMIFSMLLGIAVSAHVWIVAKREIEASEGIRIERRRKRRQSRSSLHNGRGSSSAVSSPGQHYQTHRSSAGLMTAAGTTADYFPSSNDLTSHHHNDIHHHHHTASDFVGGGYLDDQDDDQDEDQEGVSGDAEGRALFQHHNGQQQHPHHRQQGARGDESDDGSSGSDSDRTDFMDDDEYEDDIDDMERGDDGFLDHGSSWRSSIATAAATTTNGSEIEMRSHPNKITTATTTTAATATAGAISAPPTRGPSPRPRVSSGAGAMVEQENIGWFAQNGVDISDRGW